jgi:hypothetical protein
VDRDQASLNLFQTWLSLTYGISGQPRIERLDGYVVTDRPITSDEISSCALPSRALPNTVRMNAATRIVAVVDSIGRRSPKAIIPPTIGTMLESADDKGIAMIPRAEEKEFCNATIPTIFPTITPYT